MSINNDSAIPELTIDRLFSGRLVCAQSKNGYRFSVDPILLSHFVEVRENDSLLDLGAGCGIIQLIILFRHLERIKRIDGIEVQKGLYHAAVYNISANGFADKADIVQGNVKNISAYFAAESYDKILCNPPYFNKGSGRWNKNEEANLARHQIDVSIDDFLAAAAYCLKNRGGAYFVYPANLLSEIVFSAQNRGFEIKKLQCIYSYPAVQIPAKLVLVKFVKNGKRGLEVAQPFYIYEQKNGPYSPEMQTFYATDRYAPNL